MISNSEVKKPEPISIGKTHNIFNQGADVEPAIQALERGESVLVREFYNDGLSLLHDLHKYLKLNLPNTSYKEQHEYRSEYHRLSNLILLEIVDQQLCVKKSPSIGWLEKFYPENNHFFLTLPQIQGLNSAWQWYQNGISIPVLRNKVHPYYGTYFPTRFEHLVLFDNWLKHYKGLKKTAIEIGIGCGVLSLQMIQHQFQKVYATDINPNAIIGLTEFMGTTKLSRKIELDLGHLFGKWDNQTELIVFNPPWMPGAHDFSNIDDAIYYNKTLFTDFFAAAKTRLLPEGKLVLIFSNLAQITNVTQEHPIERELEEGNRFKLERCFKKSVSAASSKSKRDQYWRASEEVELWALTHI
ncbi:Methyltransferase small domain-containing protein [Formosa sp. Hel1_31_208]|uniref:methyltransferase n=1 Tax=Formosa sp. Hel1_31_208 TaxID=1798225 RepID=UPI00087C5772|nr:methyltransferase [Formosa sp. Hel1_31_208]SDS41536.1 Methyltransferase small domain-containing protein [Formosa sp. Hel1_31_208]